MVSIISLVNDYDTHSDMKDEAPTGSTAKTIRYISTDEADAAMCLLVINFSKTTQESIDEEEANQESIRNANACNSHKR